MRRRSGQAVERSRVEQRGRRQRLLHTREILFQAEGMGEEDWNKSVLLLLPLCRMTDKRKPSEAHTVVD